MKRAKKAHNHTKHTRNTTNKLFGKMGQGYNNKKEKNMYRVNKPLFGEIPLKRFQLNVHTSV